MTLDPVVISLISLGVSACSYINSRRARLDSAASVLYKTKFDLLKSAKEAELVWQDIVNDIYHRRSKFERIIPLTQKDVLLESFDAWDREFSGSLENAKKIRNDIEDGFDDIKKNEAEKWHRKIEVMKLSLAQSKAEMNRKFELMEQRISEEKNSKGMG